jgi:hypothetical protein
MQTDQSHRHVPCPTVVALARSEPSRLRLVVETSRPSCQRSVGIRRVITGAITEHHQLSVGFRRPPLQTCTGAIGPDQGTVWRSETHLTASPCLPFQGASMGSHYRSSL